MTNARFNQAFAAVLLLSAFCAFAVPMEYSGALQGKIGMALSPVAYPVRRVAQSINRRVQRRDDNELSSVRTLDEAKREIEQLRTLTTNLSVQLDNLRRLNESRELAGDVRKYSQAFRAVGSAGMRDMLVLAGTENDGLKPWMPVIYGRNVIGRIASVDIGGARVQLVSDVGFRATGQFCRFQRGSDGKLTLASRGEQPLLPLVEGRGSGLMSVVNLEMRRVREAGVEVGDWVVLQDPESWPGLVNGCILGEVVKIDELARQPLFAEITVKPRANPLQLYEALVVTGRPSANAAPPPAATVPRQIVDVKKETKGHAARKR